MSSLITNIHDTGDEIEGEMHWRLFDSDMTVLIYDADVEYAQRCAEYLENMPEELLDRLRRATLLYAQDFYEMTGDEELEKFLSVKPEEILEYVYPSALIVRKPQDDRIGFHLEMECDWEPEHGLEWSVLDGKVMYVGAFSSVSPWSEFRDKSWNYLTKL